jgi:hypothetical protein
MKTNDNYERERFDHIMQSSRKVRLYDLNIVLYLFFLQKQYKKYNSFFILT